MEGDLRSWVGVFRRNGRLIRRTALGALLLAGLWMLLTDPVYRATALLELSQGAGEVPTLEGVLADEDPSEEYRRTAFELLRSETLAGRVIDVLRLDTLPEFAEEDTPRFAVIRGFIERLVVAPVPDSRLVRLSFEASDPETAAAVVNTMVEEYRSLRTQARLAAAARLDVQLDSVQERLAASEQALREYTEANDLPYLVDEDVNTEMGTRLSELRTQLAEAQAARYESESLYEIVVGGGQVDVAVENDAALRDLEAQLAALQSEYARLSSTFTDQYPATAEVLRQIESVEGLIANERARVAQRVGGGYELALQREEILRQAIQEQEELAARLGPSSGRHHLLRQAVLADRQLYTALHERKREAETVAALGSTDFSIVDPAVPPTDPHRPVFAMTLGLALMFGLVLGIVAAFVREMLDDTVHNPEDLPIAREVPVLGMIPAAHPAAAMGPRNGRGSLARRRAGGATVGGGWLRIDALERGDPEGSAIADAFAALRTAVLFKEDGPERRSILVSSCRAGEGKTTISVNLAMSLAKLGHRVLLVDADLRRPAVNRALGIPSEPGLIDCLRDGRDWKALVRFGVVDGLDVLTSGGATSEAADLLATQRMEHLLRESEARYDYVVVDAPALFINATDATLLSRQVDGVLVVVRSESTPRLLVDRIPRDVPNLMGIVVNDLSKNSLPDYFGDYFAEYGPGREAEAPSGNGRGREPGEDGASAVARAGRTEPERAR